MYKYKIAYFNQVVHEENYLLKSLHIKFRVVVAASTSELSVMLHVVVEATVLNEESNSSGPVSGCMSVVVIKVTRVAKEQSSPRSTLS